MDDEPFRARSLPMATFTITLEDGRSFSCADDTYILDAAEE
jgi:ferredoxin